MRTVSEGDRVIATEGISYHGACILQGETGTVTFVGAVLDQYGVEISWDIRHGELIWWDNTTLIVEDDLHVVKRVRKPLPSVLLELAAADEGA
jgi:hypothetical protein